MEPIGKARRGFPWLLLIGLVVAGLTVLGVRQHLATREAWEARFAGKPEVRQQVETADATDRESRLRLIREQRASAEARQIREKLEQIIKEDEAGNLKCISGTAFRRIPGGWENIPNITCSN